MPITINLKQLEYIDGDNLKLDKVNYNFDQLVANGGGPQGTTGYQGTMGYQGTTGYQGDTGLKGDQGFQGNQGPAGGEYWIKIDGRQSDYTADTLLPANDATVNSSAPVVKIGYISTDTGQYAAESPITITASGNQQLPAQFVVNRKSYFGSNISLTTDGTSNSFDFKLESNTDSSGNAITTLSQGFSEINNIGLIKIFANSHVFLDSSSNSELIKVNSASSVFTKQIEAEKDVTISGDLTVETDYASIALGAPDTDKIATSADATGKLKFQTIQELGGGIPVGTIVGVLSSVFEQSSNFIQQQLNYDASSGAIEFTIGRGIGDYAGWYLCNGQVWKNSTGVGTVAYEVPDLNGYDYIIDDAPGATGQGLATTNGSAKKSIMGGADITLNAANSVSSQYNITHTNDYVEDLVTPDSSGTQYAIKKVPQIIYLGETDLFFKIPGTANPTYTNTYQIIFSDVGTYGNPSYQTTSGSTLFNVTAPAGSVTGQSFQLNMGAPSGYLWTGTQYPPSWTLPNGVTISSPVFGGPGGNNTNGWPEVQYVITVNQQLAYNPSNIQIAFDTNQDNALTILNQVAQTYEYNAGSPWNYDATQQTKTGTIGYSVALDPIILTAPSGKYFDNLVTPTVGYAYYGSGSARTSDFSVTNHTYSDVNQNGQYTKLTLNITDNDFANENEVQGGLSSSQSTTLSFGATVYDMLPALSPNGTSGQLYNNSPLTRQYTVTNNTGSTIYVAAWIQNFTNNVQTTPGVASMDVTWNNKSKYISGNENQTQNGRTATTTINHLGSVTDDMVVTNAGGDSSWFAKLMWTDNPTITTQPWDTPTSSNGWNTFL